MSNLRLKDHTWDASNVYDSSLGKTQDKINAMTGRDGADGVSPEVSVTEITGGHRITITDVAGTHTFVVPDGVNGANGADGADGADGDPAPSADVAAAVNAWLDSNIAQETGYVIDDSLTVTGAAADAKKTGEIKTSVDELNSTVLGELNDVAYYNKMTLYDEDFTHCNVRVITHTDGTMETSGVCNYSGWVQSTHHKMISVEPGTYTLIGVALEENTSFQIQYTLNIENISNFTATPHTMTIANGTVYKLAFTLTERTDSFRLAWRPTKNYTFSGKVGLLLLQGDFTNLTFAETDWKPHKLIPFHPVIRENFSFNRKRGVYTEKRIEFDFKVSHIYCVRLKFNNYTAPIVDGTNIVYAFRTEIFPSRTIGRSGAENDDVLTEITPPNQGDVYERVFIPIVGTSGLTTKYLLSVTMANVINADYDIDIEILCADKHEAFDYLNRKNKLSERRANDVVRQMKYRFKSDSAVTPLSLLWFTDLHNDWNALSDIMEFAGKHLTYIDDVIHTGDLVELNRGVGWYNLSTTFDLISGSENILNCIGNHDIQNTSSADRLTTKQTYDRTIGNYIPYWNVVQPEYASTNGLNYYYKDYELPATDSVNNKTIRLIVLDCMYGAANGQTEWLEGVLNDALSKNYPVICANHYQPGTVYSFNTPFSSLIGFTTSSENPTHSIETEKVKSFIDNGGEFICWLTGHTHHDYVGTLAYDPHQICITLATAACRFATGQDRNYSIPENWNTWNMISFNPVYKTISVARFGAEYDMFARHKDTMTINYATRTLING